MLLMWWTVYIWSYVEPDATFYDGRVVVLEFTRLEILKRFSEFR